MVAILHKELSYQVVGAAMEVHRILGPGFLEAVYQSALAHELTLRKIPFKQLPVTYKDKPGGNYEADIVVNNAIILELKAANTLHQKHEAQAINYLVATGLQLAILLNFGGDSLQHKRLIRTRKTNS